MPDTNGRPLRPTSFPADLTDTQRKSFKTQSALVSLLLKPLSLPLSLPLPSKTAASPLLPPGLHAFECVVDACVRAEDKRHGFGLLLRVDSLSCTAYRARCVHHQNEGPPRKWRGLVGKKMRRDTYTQQVVPWGVKLAQLEFK